MRTTMNLPDGLMAEVKAKAAHDRRTVTSLVEQALRMLLQEETQPVDVPPLPSWGSPGDDVLVDVSDQDAVWGALDATT